MDYFHALGMGTLATLVIHDVIVEEEKQLLFAGVRWIAQQLTAQFFERHCLTQQSPPVLRSASFYQPGIGYFTPDL